MSRVAQEQKKAMQAAALAWQEGSLERAEQRRAFEAMALLNPKRKVPPVRSKEVLSHRAEAALVATYR